MAENAKPTQNSPVENEEKPIASKIGIGWWVVLIGVAAFFDVLQIIFAVGVIVGSIIDLFALGTFWLIFALNGEKFSKKTLGTGAIIGFIPFVNMIPEWTGVIIKLYLDAKKKNALAKAHSANNVVRMTPKNNPQTGQNDSDLQKAA